MAGNARKELEAKSGRKVVSRENYLSLTQWEKKAKRVGKGKAAVVAKKSRSKKG